MRKSDRLFRAYVCFCVCFATVPCGKGELFVGFGPLSYRPGVFVFELGKVVADCNAECGGVSVVFVRLPR